MNRVGTDAITLIRRVRKQLGVLPSAVLKLKLLTLMDDDNVVHEIHGYNKEHTGMRLAPNFIKPQ